MPRSAASHRGPWAAEAAGLADGTGALGHMAQVGHSPALHICPPTPGPVSAWLASEGKRQLAPSWDGHFQLQSTGCSQAVDTVCPVAVFKGPWPPP